MEKNKPVRFRTLFASPVFSKVGFLTGVVSTVTKTKESNAIYDQPSLNTLDCYYSVVECKKRHTSDSQEVWDSWNKVFLSILHRYSSILSHTDAPLSDVKKIASEIPRTYSVWSKINQIESELFDEEDSLSCHVNVKSFVSMIRFLPVLDDRYKELSFYFNETSNSFGFVLAKNSNSKQRLDLRFKDNGEILFSFVDGSEGFSRISGTSFLTDYLSNSSKIKKIINLFDY
jgi:hypothetical protein